MTTLKSARENAAAIVRDAGGQIVGRTRIQKMAYLMELAGFDSGFRFAYRHYGPFSEELADAIESAKAFGLVIEHERRASWGGTYSKYITTSDVGVRQRGARARFAEEAAKIDPVELELAATAAYLYVVEHHRDPWGETARRKPEKAEGNRLERAKKAYQKLASLKTTRSMPKIAD